MKLFKIFPFFLFFLSLLNPFQIIAQSKPNVVLVITDDQGYGDLASHGNPYLPTGSIDRFKEESTSFNRFYVSPVCAPTRASLLSGKWAIGTGVWGVTHRNEVMPSEVYTLAEMFKDHGYKTGAFGKWHNGAQYPENPLGQGFETFLGFTAGHHNNYFNTTLINEHQEKIETEGYITDVVTDRAVEFIQNCSNSKPFFCYVPINTPHSPFQIADTYFKKYKSMGLSDKDAAVYGMCENIDENFAKLLRAIDKKGIKDNTIVIFMTDNGPNGERYNANMKGIKASNDEGGVRVPFFIRYPGKIKPNQVIEKIAAHIDVMPTLASYCGIKIDTNAIDGVDLQPLINNPKADIPDRYIFSHWSGLTWSPSGGSVRNNEYRLVVRENDTNLYNMVKDPFQKNDIKDSEQEISKQLHSIYNDWVTEQWKMGNKTVPIKIGYKEAPTTLIEAHELNINSGLSFHGKYGWANDWIENWDEKKDTVSLSLTVKNEGTFNFEIEYQTEDSKIGSTLTLTTQDKRLEANINEPFVGTIVKGPDRVARKEVDEQSWGRMQLGELYLKEGTTEIKLFAEDIKNKKVLDLKSLIITFKEEN
ncbi:arylsulfatase [Galbibacter sp. BG1]|uniref:arylsulfatase n=1 Tax=Galbibacter sp. BG1 TaxID=1170699 RepID=UPI0015BBD536|nr:arylsulfatase [Galbibacter sp. BG1]QLE00158.1 arylsulfatase [Galbibacter sp. BG1]